MKKIIYFFLFLVISTNVYAQNEIYSIDVDVYIDENAVATIEEKWDVKGQDGTEWYKVLRNLGESQLSEFSVSMDGTPLKEKPWIVSESLSEKKGYYGINYSGADTELCFGKYDYNHHIFVLKYKLDNYIFNTDDAQVLYWTYTSKLQNVHFQNMSVKITSYYPFPDTLDVWGYGYKGYAYVKDGAIYLSNEENTFMTGNYMVALVKFPQESFKTDYFVSNFNSFNDVYSNANIDTFKYDYSTLDNNNSSSYIKNFFYNILFFVLSLGFFGGMIALAIHTIISNNYGYKDNKKIKRKETLPFRDIPCNKNIFYANALIQLNRFNNDYTNILGAIILKWLREGKITIDQNKKIQTINLLDRDTIFNNIHEQKLYKMLYGASNNGVLDTKIFKRWARNHYSEFLNLFREMKDMEIADLRKKQHIYKRTNKKECKYKNVMDDYLYEDSKKLLGHKIFLEEFSSMKNKEAIEVHLWDEYLMFAYLFGIAEKVAKQLRNLYPEIYEQNNFDYRYVYFINNISRSSINAASRARSAAQSYSSGGGGFSSGGGGGGSFGGGGFSGGGSR